MIHRTFHAAHLHFRRLLSRSRMLLLLSFLIGLLAPPASAQTTNADHMTPMGLKQGQPAGSYALSGFDNVNPYNGNLNFHLPLLSIGGRGAAQSAMMLKIDTKGWRVSSLEPTGDEAPQGAIFYVTPNYWYGREAGYGPGVMLARISGLTNSPCSNHANYYYRTLTRLAFISSDGTEYALRDALTDGEAKDIGTANPCTMTQGASRGRVFVSTGGEGATFISDQVIYDVAGQKNSLTEYGVTGYFLLKDGTRYRIDNGNVTWLRDRNGNRISFTYSGVRVTRITDSLNREVSVEYSVTDVSPYGVCDRITYKGFGGANRIIRVSKKRLGDALRPGSGYGLKTARQLFPEIPNADSVNPYNPWRISRVWLPDDRSYQFFYNSYAELARVELPTGGAIEYDHTTGSGVIDAGDNITGHDYQIWRRVKTRRLYSDGGTLHYGGTLEGKTTWSDPLADCAALPCWGDTAITVDQLSASNGRMGRQKHYYYGSPIASLWGGGAFSYPGWKEGREYRTEIHDAASTQTNPQVLRSVEQTWAQRAAVAWHTGGADSAPQKDPRVTQAVTTLQDTGTAPYKMSKQTYSYDQYNNQTDVYEYDYGDGEVGPFRRRTHTDYLTINEVNNEDYASLSTDPGARSGCADCDSIPDSEPPVAVVGGPYSGQTEANITFNGSGSHDDFGITHYQWSFGDGTSDIGAIAWHAYAQAGTYNVKLTVWDGESQYDVSTTTATISLSPTPTPTPTPTPGTGPTPTPTPTPPTEPGMDTTIHIRNLPTQQWVSSDVGGAQKKAITTYEYDNYTPDTGNKHAGLLSRAGISGLDSSFTSSKKTRGNVTALTRRLVQESRDITSYQQYDVAGNLVKAIDARGSATAFDFTDRFGVPSDHEARTNTDPAELVSKNSYALATKVTMPSVGGLAQVSYTQYDYYTGKPVNAEDPNGTVYSGYYNDTLDRPTQVVRAANDTANTIKSQTRFIYDDANHLVRTTSDRTSYDDDVLKTEMIYDGLGRTVERRTFEDATNYVSVEQQYDGMGRVKTTSNPYRPLATPAETAVWTTNTYDELGRITQVQTPDLAKVNMTYQGNITTVRDQDLKKRESRMDALGRLVEVIEDPEGLAYLTTYQYDVLDSLTKVLQGLQTRTFTYDSLKRLTQAVNPESGTLKYEYDDNGNLTKKIDPRVITSTPLVNLETTFTYDALNRVTSKTYNDNGATPNVLYKYDNQALPYWGSPGATIFDRGASIGRLVSVTYGGKPAGTYYGYDALGRVVERVQQTENVNYKVNATYNRAGAMVTETYPEAAPGTTRRSVTHSFDGAGRLRSLSTSGAAVSNIAYAAHGGLLQQSYGTLLHSIEYNSRLQPIRIKLEKSADETIVPLHLAYNYGTTNNNGNVKSASITIEGEVWNQTFTYDPLNRIDIATETKGGGTQWTQAFDYDRYGNRCLRSNATTACVPEIKPANNNRLNAFSYDVAGNQISDEDHTYTYDAENHIKTVDGEAAYVYDGEGQRVRKLLSENLLMVYGIGGELLAEYDGASGELKKEYIYGVSGLAATIEPGAGPRYVTADILGTPRILTVWNGAVAGRHDYQPFGEELLAGMGNRTTAQGYSSPADSLRQKFTGKERDNETGLDHFGARYYASIQGRFNSPDDFLKDSDPRDPQSWNKYIYVRNNPLKYIDPTGEKLTATISTDPDKKTGTIDITASFAIYSPNGDVSQADLEKQAALLKKQIESTYTGSFTENGITYTVSANVTVQVLGSKEAEDRGSRGLVDNLVAVVDAKTVSFVGNDLKFTEANAYMYRNEGEEFDRMTVALHAPLETNNTYAHEFGHIVPHISDGNVMQRRGPFPSKITNGDFKAIFGSSTKSHMETRKGAFGSILRGRHVPCSYCSPLNPSKHVLRAYYVSP